ncbi:MAG: tetratricopeptide repeat protein [Verrucomicrobiae bacterium]|nr:tetratricopeptide repeat protein [Verrucomicrobiae bacterium]
MPEKTIQEISKAARDCHEKGRIAVERKNYEDALHFLGACLESEPGFLQGRKLLRVAQLRRVQGGGAISRIFGSMGGMPALTKAMASMKKDPAKALRAAEKALESNPNNVQALRLAAQAAELMDLPQTAIFMMECARDLSPEDVGLLMDLGRLYQAGGEAHKGRGCYERVLELQPSNAEAFKGLKDATANEAMDQGGWQNADSYRDMIKDKQEAISLEQQARIFRDEDVVRARMADVFKATQQEPLAVSNWRELGELALQVNEFDYALQCLAHAFELTGRADVSLEKKVTDARVKRLAFAIEAKEAELQADPSAAALAAELEALKSERDKVKLEDCESRARRYPNDLDIRYELAQLYYRAGLVDKALPEFQLASGNPKNKNACNLWTGRCFRRKGILDLAVARLRQAAEACLIMDSLKKEILYELGDTLLQMGKKEEAIEEFKALYDADVNYRDVAQKVEDFYRSQAGV